jgi:death-on-curing protein
MDECPLFLTLDEVLRLHAFQVEQFGGDGQVLDLRLLESAVAMPQQAFGGRFLHESLAEMAAAYLFHIVRNHAFADGNKRTGMHAAIVFLELNGYELDLPVDEAETLTLAVAEGKVEKKVVAEFFRGLMADA